MLFMTFYAFLIISVHNILNFGHFSPKHYGRTKGRTDNPFYSDGEKEEVEKEEDEKGVGSSEYSFIRGGGGRG